MLYELLYFMIRKISEISQIQWFLKYSFEITCIKITTFKTAFSPGSKAYV